MHFNGVFYYNSCSRGTLKRKPCPQPLLWKLKNPPQQTTTRWQEYAACGLIVTLTLKNSAGKHVDMIKEQKIMILCDTNILIEVSRNNKTIDKILNNIGFQNIVVSDVVRAELFFGARNKLELQMLRKSLNAFTSLPIQPDISALAVALIMQYCLSHKLDFHDALIAATAIIHNIELYTLNVKDFAFIPQLRLFRP
jgi:predicted nucleic acid-binding protein